MRGLGILVIWMATASLVSCSREPTTAAHYNPTVASTDSPLMSEIDRLKERVGRLSVLEGRLEDVEAGQQILVELLAETRHPLDGKVIQKLKNNTGLTLQWIGDNPRGNLAVIESKNGDVLLQGRQSGSGNDFLAVDGKVALTTATAFVMLGTIEIDVQQLRERGDPSCRREGAFTFRITGDRKYWRLLEKTGHCGVRTDYVDIFL